MRSINVIDSCSSHSVVRTIEGDAGVWKSALERCIDLPIQLTCLLESRSRSNSDSPQ
jgi:hypothetical protein